MAASRGRSSRKVFRNGDIGRIGLAVSRSQPQTVYATLETNTTEVYRSDDYGASWTKKGTYFQFPWYMGQIRVDPENPDRLYELGVPLSCLGGRRSHRSPDRAIGARRLSRDVDQIRAIPITSSSATTAESTSRTIVARRWTSSPISRSRSIYAIDLDNRQPFYYVYGGLQDNNSWAGPSQTRNRQGITNNDWYVTVGGDGFYSAVDPTDPNTVYAESQNGGIIRYDVNTGEQKSIQPQAKFG